MAMLMYEWWREHVHTSHVDNKPPPWSQVNAIVRDKWEHFASAVEEHLENKR